MVGGNIKKYLIDRGITQAFLSEKTRIPANILSQSLNEKRAIKAEEYFIICEALGVPLDTFKDRLKIDKAS